MTAALEMSQGGHVHVHALYLGPHVPMTALNKRVFGDQWRIDDPMRQGTIVIGGLEERAKRVESANQNPMNEPLRRELTTTDAQPVPMGDHLQGALRETLKYVVKGPSPMRDGWIGGEKLRGTHPKLAAAWHLATRRMQSRRHYGQWTKTLAALPKRPESEKPDRETCASCGELLPDRDSGAWRHDWTDAVARKARDRWRSIVVQRTKPNIYGTRIPRRPSGTVAACQDTHGDMAFRGTVGLAPASGAAAPWVPGLIGRSLVG